MTGFMDPVKRAELELEALMGKPAPSAEEPPKTDGNPGDNPAPDPGEGVAPDGNAPAVMNPPADPPKSEDAEYWRQRFEVMQGKYNAEVPRLIEQVNAMNAQMQALQAQLENGGNGNSEPTAQKPGTVEEALAQLQNEYGSELTDALDRLIQARLRSVEEKVSNVETVTAKTAYEKFLDAMDTKVPTWRTVNTDPGFLAFIETPEPFGGVPYKALLAHAAQSCDSERVARIFNLYINQNPAATTPKSQRELPPNPEQLVAPSRRGTGEPPTTQDQSKKIWTLAEVNAFYKALELGRYRGKEQEAERIEAEILRANKEGRIVG